MITWRLDLYIECFDALKKACIEISDIYMPEEIKVIPCNSELERLDIVIKANKFIEKFTTEETFENIYKAITVRRGGRFYCNNKYFIKNTDMFYVNAFVNSRNNISYAEIWSSANDCIAAYVRL